MHSATPAPRTDLTRRELLALGASAGLATFASAQPARAASDKVYRIGVISASNEGKPQTNNGHTWQFCHPFHSQLDMDVVKKVHGPAGAKYYAEYMRNPKTNFDEIPFADTTLTHVYDADPKSAALFAEGFKGVQVAPSVEKMVEEVDAVWLGDASGLGDDHFDLIAPALEKGLPTFCDKPIGGTVAGTRAILDLAKKHKAPLMSSSIFRHEWGTAEALRMRDSGEYGPINFATCAQASDCSPRGWLVYGQHPVWMLVTLCGAGISGVSSYHREGTCHAMLTYPDRMPAMATFGRPDVVGNYCETTVHFQKPRSKKFTYTPAIEGNFNLGHAYEVFRMADAFRGMIRTGIEPAPHQEILEVTAVIHAAVKSQNEKSRLVALEEVM
jgi:predicted dehydrogenase